MTSKNSRILEDYLTQDQAAAELSVCSRTLDRWRVLAMGPPVTKIGRQVYYRRSSVMAWLQAREVHRL